MKETVVAILIFLGVVAVLAVIAITIGCVAIAWCHYPQGIIKAMKQKKEREKQEAEKHDTVPK